VYHGWQREVPQGVDVCAIELPGRWQRSNDPLIGELSALIRALSDALVELCDVPFSIYGHSFGALLGFEFAREIRRRLRRTPRLFLAAAHKAPQLEFRFPPIHELSDREFLAVCSQRYGQIDQRLLQDAEMRSAILKPLRADMSLIQAYSYQAEEPLDGSLRAWGGRADESVSEVELRAWTAQTTGPAEFEYLDGGHLFLKDNAAGVLRKVRSELADHLD
jgi:surfactin synthase thioesterase subunit